jgi:hypothetical protein
MKKSIEVVDGFYRDPRTRRERALGSGWTEELFPDQEATARLGELLGLDASLPTLSGRFTFVGADDGGQVAPHVHDEQWAALVYLAPPEDGFSSGVEFYKPTSDAAPGLWGSSGAHAVHHHDGWEETMYVPLICNRMVLFQGAIAHQCAGRGFGATPADGRVAQLFLFDEPGGGR